MTIIACVSCDWTGRHYEARDVAAEADGARSRMEACQVDA